jgi:hypothetical protein
MSETMECQDIFPCDLKSSILGTFLPLDCLIDFSNRDFGHDEEMNNFHPILKAVCEQVKGDILKVCELIAKNIGVIEIHSRRGELVLASINGKSSADHVGHL